MLCAMKDSNRLRVIGWSPAAADGALIRGISFRCISLPVLLLMTLGRSRHSYTPTTPYPGAPPPQMRGAWGLGMGGMR